MRSSDPYFKVKLKDGTETVLKGRIGEARALVEAGQAIVFVGGGGIGGIPSELVDELIEMTEDEQAEHEQLVNES